MVGLNRFSLISVASSLVIPAVVAAAAVFNSINLPSAIVMMCVFSPLVAAFFGHAARRQILKSGQRDSKGSRLAAAGLTAGYLEIILSVVIIAFSVPHHDKWAMSEADTVGSVRTLNRASHAYADAHPQEGFPSRLGVLSMDRSQSETSWGIDQALAGGLKSRYRFTYLPRSTKGDGVMDVYQIYADPVDRPDRDARHFFTDQTETIRYSVGRPGNETSPAL